jgi:hypothetical protein
MPYTYCRKHSPELGMAHTPTPRPDGQVVYVVCGWQGCAQRLALPADVWQEELRRRQASEAPARDEP